MLHQGNSSTCKLRVPVLAPLGRGRSSMPPQKLSYANTSLKRSCSRNQTRALATPEGDDKTAKDKDVQKKELNVSTILTNVKNTFDPYDSSSTPLYLTATFQQYSGTNFNKYYYTRGGNPTRNALEELLAKLEGADRAFCFTSGMAALVAVSRLVKKGQNIVAGDNLYGGSDQLLSTLDKDFGITVRRVKTTDANEVGRNIDEDTRLVWLETPTNPQQNICDIKKISGLAHGHKHKPLVLVDNSMMSSILSRPLEHGADIVMHSASKFIAGHGDVMAGILAVKEKSLADEIVSFLAMKEKCLADKIANVIAVKEKRVDDKESLANTIVGILAVKEKSLSNEIVGVLLWKKESLEEKISKSLANETAGRLVEKKKIYANEIANILHVNAKSLADEIAGVHYGVLTIDKQTLAYRISAALAMNVNSLADEIAVLAVKEKSLADEIAGVQTLEGSALAPFDCWLCLRGIKTMALRIEKQQESAKKISNFLSGSERMKKVYYAGLSSHQGHELHNSQASGGGSVLSFTTGSLDISKHIVENTKLFSTGVSFGSVKSLISLPAFMSHASVPADKRGFDEDLIRISVGIEDVEDLIADLSQAIESANSKFAPKVINPLSTSVQGS